MNQVHQSLEQITTGYSIFEKDQVLTHDQLNSVADYCDDQTRLTRVKLLGVGIVCGLRVSVQANKITVTKGTGITTDGDLLHFAADRVFDKFKIHDESNPAYGPFYPEETLIRAYELVPLGTTDQRATALSQFTTQTGSAPGDMVAVLFMEGYVRDEDLCSGTDCDNLGKDFVNTIKLLLVEKSSAGLLKESVTTPASAFAALTEIVAERPVFNSSITTSAQLAAAYRAVCGAMHKTLLAELPKLYPNCSGFLGEVFASDPMSGWRTRLNGFQSAFAANPGIQYYYDFLKDLVETYNAFRNLLFGENTWCCPGTDRFPKHLLLGNISPGADPDENRTGFYPSPLCSRTTEALEHAKFLAGKIDTLIQTFALPAAVTAVRVTPSSTEERCLEERAIPYYYAVTTAHPIQRCWNHALRRRGMDAWNYSYNAALYEAQGGAARPLTSQIGRFSFFRIEGHLGLDVATVTTALDNEIKAHNLPFVVRSVFLGTDQTKVVKNPGGRYSDLHRFHYLLRQDAFYQLGDVSKFSGTFKGQVDTAIASNQVTNSPADNDGMAVSDLAAEKNATVTAKSSSARVKLNLGYSTYKADPSWKTDVGDTMKAAGEFKRSLGTVAKTEFNTPFDSLISNTHVLWLDWLDDIIKQKDDRADEKLLFGKFVEENPGLEHFAGVPRGGTFVLVYDADNKVIGDFMLDYRSVEEVEPEPEEPPLAKPDWKPDWIVDNGIKINPSIDKVLTLKLDAFTKEVVDPKINVQKGYLDIFKDVAGVFGNFKSGDIAAGTTDGTRYSDAILKAYAEENLAKQKQVGLLAAKAIDPELPQELRDQFGQQAKDLEEDLGRSVRKITKYVADSGIEVTAGSEGHSALLEVSKSVGLIHDATTLGTVKADLNTLTANAGNAGFQIMVGGIVSR